MSKWSYFDYEPDWLIGGPDAEERALKSFDRRPCVKEEEQRKRIAKIATEARLKKENGKKG